MTCLFEFMIHFRPGVLFAFVAAVLVPGVGDLDRRPPQLWLLLAVRV
jgi:hypothetical protein